MTSSHGFAPGKLILSGEYAVVFGHRGIAVPLDLGIDAHHEPSSTPLTIDGITDPSIVDYVSGIAKLCGVTTGTLKIESQVPVGKGLGSSTALVIAMTRCLVGDQYKKALEIEDAVNSGHSGLDFSTIWENRPVVFKKRQSVDPLSRTFPELTNAVLIDTGRPNETTPELVAWVKSQQEELRPSLDAIGECTERLIAGEDLPTVVRDHHRAQVSLGVVTEEAQDLIAEIEAAGGSAKVVGAGSRTGGCGMVLAINIDKQTLDPLLAQRTMTAFPLHP